MARYVTIRYQDRQGNWVTETKKKGLSFFQVFFLLFLLLGTLFFVSCIAAVSSVKVPMPARTCEAWEEANPGTVTCTPLTGR